MEITVPGKGTRMIMIMISLIMKNLGSCKKQAYIDTNMFSREETYAIYYRASITVYIAVFQWCLRRDCSRT